jgi:FkbM family methyltransferase
VRKGINHRILWLTAWITKLLPGQVKKAIYHSGPLAKGIRAGLNRAAPHGLTISTIASGTISGWKVSLDLQNEKDYWLGTYELDLQAALADWVKPGWVAYDVGANIGYVTLMFSKLVGEKGQVFAFEALPENLTRLRNNLTLNQVQDRVRIIPAAVIDQVRSVQFLVGPSHGMGKVLGSAGREDVDYQDKLDVAGISLDEFIFTQGNPPPQVIKIDIEGGEVLALPGMQRVITEFQPVFFLELHGSESANIVWKIFRASNYRICRMEADYQEINSLAGLDWKAYLVAIPGWLNSGKTR